MLLNKDQNIIGSLYVNFTRKIDHVNKKIILSDKRDLTILLVQYYDLTILLVQYFDLTTTCTIL